MKKYIETLKKYCSRHEQPRTGVHAFACTFRQVLGGRIVVAAIRLLWVRRSRQFHIQPPRVWIDNWKIREFSNRRTPRASCTDLASASAKVRPRLPLRLLILCRTIHACSIPSHALVFPWEFPFFFCAIFFLFSNPFLGLVTTASLDHRCSCVPCLWGPSGASRFTSGHRHSRCCPTHALFFWRLHKSRGPRCFIRRSFLAPFTCLGVAALVTHDVNFAPQRRYTRVVVRWICSGFLRSFAPTSQQFSPAIYAVSNTRSVSIAAPTRLGSRDAVDTSFSSHVRPSSVNIFVSAVFSVCGARVVSAYYTFNRFIHLTSPDPALYFRSASKSLCYSVNNVHCLSSKVQ